MKNLIKIAVFSLFLFLAISGYTQTKINIAVLELSPAGVSPVEAKIFSDRLRTDLFNTDRFIVLERDKVNEILREQGFQSSGCTTNECAIEIGRLIGVQQMVAGNIGKLGQLYTLNLRLIDVQTGQVIKTATQDCRCSIETVLTKSLKAAAGTLASDKSYQYKPEEEATDTGSKSSLPVIHKDIEYAASLIARGKVPEGKQILDNIIVNSENDDMITQALAVKMNYAQRLLERDQEEAAAQILDEVISKANKDSLMAKSLYLKIKAGIDDPEDIEKLKIYYPDSPYTKSAIKVLTSKRHGDYNPFLYVSSRSNFRDIFLVDIFFNGEKVNLEKKVRAPFWRIDTDFTVEFDTEYEIEIVTYNMGLPTNKMSENREKTGVRASFKLKTPEYDSKIKYHMLLFNIEQNGTVKKREFVEGR